MHESFAANSRYTITSKTRVLITVAALFILSPFVTWLAYSSETAYSIGNIAVSIGVLVCCLIWVSIDANEKGLYFGYGFRIAMILLTPAALIYYFYKSRGFKHGSRTLAKAIGLYIALIIAVVIVSIILSLIDGTFWEF